MNGESIAGLIGLAIGLLVLVALSVFESRTYRREHDGEGMLHHWTHQHLHMPHWRRPRHWGAAGVRVASGRVASGRWLRVRAMTRWSALRRVHWRALHAHNVFLIPPHIKRRRLPRAALSACALAWSVIAAIVKSNGHMPCWFRASDRRVLHASIVAARMRQTSVTMRPAISRPPQKENAMTVGTILLIVLILLLIGALPSWPYSSGWGYRPTGLVGVVLIIVIILLLLGRI
jgi:hypothetical protein